MRGVDDISRDELRDLLGRGWLAHDGIWFCHIYREPGIETASRLNRAAINSLALIEMDRVAKWLGVQVGRIDTFEERNRSRG